MAIGFSGLVLGGRYEVYSKMSEGSFGEIYSAKDNVTKKVYAAKAEYNRSNTPQLEYEYSVYRALRGSPGVPEVHWYGMKRGHKFLVMDFLGNNLEDVFTQCRRLFSVNTVAILAEHMINHLELLHSKGYVHRDIKPDNFCLGEANTPDARSLFIIDFGLSKKYINTKTKRHITVNNSLKKRLTGTPRYASINAQSGLRQSRRDDLESLAYILIYFLRGGRLPWQGLKAPSWRKREQMILGLKMTTAVEELCEGLPSALSKFLVYARNLGFKETPDYDYIRGLFGPLKNGNSYDWVMCSTPSTPGKIVGQDLGELDVTF